MPTRDFGLCVLNGSLEGRYDEVHDQNSGTSWSIPGVAPPGPAATMAVYHDLGEVLPVSMARFYYTLRASYIIGYAFQIFGWSSFTTAITLDQWISGGNDVGQLNGLTQMVISSLVNDVPQTGAYNFATANVRYVGVSVPYIVRETGANRVTEFMVGHSGTIYTENPETPVDPPINVVLTSGTGKITVTWSGTGDTFKVYRGTDCSSLSLVATVTTNSFTDQPLTGGNYCYRISAVVGGIESALTPCTCTRVWFDRGVDPRGVIRKAKPLSIDDVRDGRMCSKCGRWVPARLLTYVKGLPYCHNEAPIGDIECDARSHDRPTDSRF